MLNRGGHIDLGGGGKIENEICIDSFRKQAVFSVCANFSGNCAETDARADVKH